MFIVVEHIAMEHTITHADSNPAGVNKLTPAQVAKRIERVSGRKPHISTVIRWVVKGCGGRKLPAIRVGGYWLIDPIDADNFIQVLNAGPTTAAGISADARVGAQLESMLGSKREAAVEVVTVRPDQAVKVSRRGAR